MDAELSMLCERKHPQGLSAILFSEDWEDDMLLSLLPTWTRFENHFLETFKY